MDDKSNAVNEAKSAAMSSVGFVLTGTKQEAVGLKTAARAAARAAVSLSKNMEVFVSKFKSYEKQISDIQGVLGKGGQYAAQVRSISGILAAKGNAYKKEESDAEDKAKPTIAGTTKEAADAIAASVPMVSMFIAAIAALMSPEVRALLTGFFDGLMESLGLSQGAIEKVKLYTGIAIGILGLYFASSVLSQVGQAFSALQKLAVVMGLAGQKIAVEKTVLEAEQAKIDAEKNKVKKAGDLAKDDMKSTKDELKKGKKENIFSRTKKLFQVIGPKLAKLVGTFLKALPIIGTVLGIGYLLYDMFDIGRDIYNFIMGKEDDEGDAEAEKQKTAAVAASSSDTAPPAAAAAAVGAPTTAATSESPKDTTAAPPPPASVSNGETSSSKLESSPTTDASTVKAQSYLVDQMERDNQHQDVNISVVNVNNNNTIVKEKDKKPTGSISFSTTVGA